MINSHALPLLRSLSHHLLMHIDEAVGLGRLHATRLCCTSMYRKHAQSLEHQRKISCIFFVNESTFPGTSARATSLNADRDGTHSRTTQVVSIWEVQTLSTAATGLCIMWRQVGKVREVRLTYDCRFIPLDPVHAIICSCRCRCKCKVKRHTQ